MQIPVGGVRVVDLEREHPQPKPGSGRLWWGKIEAHQLNSNVADPTAASPSGRARHPRDRFKPGTLHPFIEELLPSEDPTVELDRAVHVGHVDRHAGHP